MAEKGVADGGGVVLTAAIFLGLIVSCVVLVLGFGTASPALELSKGGSFGGRCGFDLCDKAWRRRVTVFNPTAMKDEISGIGGMGGPGESSPSCCFDSGLLRFLHLFPFDLTR
jgi:hypothetical protein